MCLLAVRTIGLCALLALCFAACGSDDSGGSGGTGGAATGGSGGAATGGSGGAATGGSGGAATGGSGGSGGGAPCVTADDCRLFSSYCDGCSCLVLAKTDADPICNGSQVNCEQDPCNGFGVECVAKTCVKQGGV